jgi:dihydrofolate reductase
MRVSVIVALDRNGLIGTEHGLPWHLPRDLRRFRELTMGKPIIMGRTTREHIGRPLPGRHNIVLTRKKEAAWPGSTTAASLDEALAIAAKESEEAFLIGGAAVYREALPRADRLYLTLVDGRFVGTTYFPRECVNQAVWKIHSREVCEPDEKNRFRHIFYVLERVPNEKRGDVAIDLNVILSAS